MGGSSRRRHWESVWQARASEDLGWFQDLPQPSLGVILEASAGRDTAVIDVGGGDSRLVDQLLQAGYRDLTVLDVSPAALDRARERLGARATEVSWIETDVTGFEPARTYDLWHDRAVFHFLTEPEDRAAYRRALFASVAEGGQVVISTFSLAGPSRCSGLDVARYSAESLAVELGPSLRLVDSLDTFHRTPGGVEQAFVTCRLVRRGRSGA